MALISLAEGAGVDVKISHLATILYAYPNRFVDDCHELSHMTSHRVPVIKYLKLLDGNITVN